MTITFKVKNKGLDIKFDYRTMFKANRELGSLDENGNKNSDGASNLFNRILNFEDEAVHDLIRLAFNGKLSDNEVFEAIENYIDENGGDEAGYEQLFEDVLQEMKSSGFFVKKVKQQVKNMEKAKLLIEKRAETKQELMQVEGLQNMIDTLNNAL